MGRVHYFLPIAADAPTAQVWHYCPRRVAGGRSYKEFDSADFAASTGQMKELVGFDGKDRAGILSEFVSHTVKRLTGKVEPCVHCGVELFLTWERNRVVVESTLPSPGGLP